jgi:hypothetical protein
MKIYSDTDSLLSNARHSDPKTQKERDALVELLALHRTGDVMIHKSLVVYRELMATADTELRLKLQADYETLKKVENDEKLLGFNTVFDQYGGFCCSPLVADVQDEELRKRLMDGGLSQKDAEHLTQAICNGCDVFLTRDEATIINPHRHWIEEEFPKIKIKRPTELLAQLHGSTRPDRRHR